MSFLLMVFLTLVCYPNPDSYPAPLFGGSLAGCLLAGACMVAFVGLHAWWVSRSFSRPVARDVALRDVLLPRYDRGRFRHQVLLFFSYALLLLAGGWGFAMHQLASWNDWTPPGLELLVLAPLLAGMAVSWVFFYDADRTAHRAAHRLLDADPFAHAWTETHPAVAATQEPAEEGDGSFGGRWSYVAFQARQKLALVFIPVLLLITVKGLSRLLDRPGGRPDAQAFNPGMGLLALAVVFVFVCMPLLVRLMLGLKPLPPGPLRERLLSASRRLGFRCSDILLWNTRNGMANAMVVGLVPWLRYVVFTDRLVQEFTDDEVEAVFGHEIGHIRHHHMLYYLCFLGLSMMALGLIADNYFVPLFKDEAGRTLFAEFLPAEFDRLELAAVPVVVLMLGYVFVVFGLLSRRCERQADVFGCRAVSCHSPICCGHDPDTPRSAGGKDLCPTGIRTFIRALEKVAEVNGISRERPGFLQSWQHGTIARRVSFLERLLHDPRAETVFQRRVLVFRWVLLTGLAALLAVLLAALLKEDNRPPTGRGPAATGVEFSGR